MRISQLVAMHTSTLKLSFTWSSTIQSAHACCMHTLCLSKQTRYCPSLTLAIHCISHAATPLTYDTSSFSQTACCYKLCCMQGSTCSNAHVVLRTLKRPSEYIYTLAPCPCSSNKNIDASTTLSSVPLANQR